MRDLQKMCRICLGNGTRDLFESSLGSNLLARDDLARLAEKLRYVTLLKVNPKENLPRQICDLCIVQLNVSYNFKRLASKNDFQIRQYMIENGLPLIKDDDDSNVETTTALEIHQIHHIRTSNRFRQIAAPEIRRNSTTSSVSGTSTMIINGRDNNSTPISAPNTFVHPRPIVKPIQIKVEPNEDEVEEEPNKDESLVTSSPSNSSEPSILTVYSSTAPSEKAQTAMVSIMNVSIDHESPRENTQALNLRNKTKVSPAPLSVKLRRQQEKRLEMRATQDALKEKSRRNLRTIKKNDLRKSKRKLKAVAQKIKTVTKKDQKKMHGKSDQRPMPRPRGRPPKDPNTPKMTYKKRKTAAKS